MGKEFRDESRMHIRTRLRGRVESGADVRAHNACAHAHNVGWIKDGEWSGRGKVGEGWWRMAIYWDVPLRCQLHKERKEIREGRSDGQCGEAGGNDRDERLRGEGEGTEKERGVMWKDGDPLGRPAQMSWQSGKRGIEGVWEMRERRGMTKDGGRRRMKIHWDVLDVWSGMGETEEEKYGGWQRKMKKRRRRTTKDGDLLGRPRCGNRIKAEKQRNMKENEEGWAIRPEIAVGFITKPVLLNGFAANFVYFRISLRILFVFLVSLRKHFIILSKIWENDYNFKNNITFSSLSVRKRRKQRGFDSKIHIFRKCCISKMIFHKILWTFQSWFHLGITS